MTVLERMITVANTRGVHSRVATGLAIVAREHGVQLEIINGDDQIDGSSILDTLSMALVNGTRITVRVGGEMSQAELAMRAVERILTAEDEE